jgi:hypothetical protein
MHDASWRLAGLLLGLLALSACATRQKVSLECVPREVTVYVDGRALEETPDEIELSRDEPHTVFFKGGGYQPQMVVLESAEVDGRQRLEPSEPCAEVVFVKMRPELQIEVDPEQP